MNCALAANQTIHILQLTSSILESYRSRDQVLSQIQISANPTSDAFKSPKIRPN